VTKVERVVTLLHGGVGNQLFQYTAAISVVNDHDPASVRAVSYGSEWGPEHPDLASLAGIEIQYPDRRLRSIYRGIAVRESWRDDISMVTARMWGALKGIELVHQDDPFAPPPSTPLNVETVVLDGFFQHYEWWANAWQNVARIVDAQRPDGVDDLRREGRTAVKLRRSDYLGRGIVLTDEYYRRALRVLDVRDCEVVVVCEDADYLPHFARILDEVGCQARIPEPITGNPNIDDFWQLAAAKRQVLANSSYCWWAAAVAGTAMGDTQVAYPTPWLPNSWSTGTLPDMGLPGWVSIATEFE
jgi:hypothetical protein